VNYRFLSEPSRRPYWYRSSHNTQYKQKHPTNQ